MMLRLILAPLISVACSTAAGSRLSALVLDGMNNHDWAAGTRAIQSVLEGSARFTDTLSTWPAKPDFSHYDVVCNNFIRGHQPARTSLARQVPGARAAYGPGGGWGIRS